MLCARVRACVRAYLTPLKHGHKESSIFCPRYFTIFYLPGAPLPPPPPPGARPPPPPPGAPPPPRGMPISISIFNFLWGGGGVLCGRVRACVHPLSTGTRRVINFTISIFNFLCCAVRACTCVCAPLKHGHKESYKITISIFNFCAVLCARVRACVKHGHKMSYKITISILCCAVRARTCVCACVPNTP